MPDDAEKILKRIAILLDKFIEIAELKIQEIKNAS